tara:strand:+ start:778 stop:993 length:216 start_codon:yes stop_codon:yes gene_type:complete
MNELITLEINSKNKQKLIDVLNENNLVVEYLNIEQTYTVAGRDEDERVNPQPRVLEPSLETQFNYNISETT